MVGRAGTGSIVWQGRQQAAISVGRVIARGMDSVYLPPEQVYPERQIRHQLGTAAWEHGISVRMRRTGRTLQVRRHHFVVRTADRFITSLTTLDQVIGMAALHGRLTLLAGPDDPPADTLVPVVLGVTLALHRAASVWADGAAIELRLRPEDLGGTDRADRDRATARRTDTDLDAQRVSKAMNEVPPL